MLNTINNDSNELVLPHFYVLNLGNPSYKQKKKKKFFATFKITHKCINAMLFSMSLLTFQMTYLVLTVHNEHLKRAIHSVS